LKKWSLTAAILVRRRGTTPTVAHGVVIAVDGNVVTEKPVVLTTVVVGSKPHVVGAQSAS